MQLSLATESVWGLVFKKPKTETKQNETKPNHGIAHLITTAHATIKYMPTMLFAGGKNLSDSDSDVRRIGRQSNLMVKTTVCTSELRNTWSNEIESCFAIHLLNVINESAQIGAIQRLRFSACHRIAVYSGDNQIIFKKKIKSDFEKRPFQCAQRN